MLYCFLRCGLANSLFRHRRDIRNWEKKWFLMSFSDLNEWRCTFQASSWRGCSTGYPAHRGVPAYAGFPKQSRHVFYAELWGWSLREAVNKETWSVAEDLNEGSVGLEWGSGVPESSGSPHSAGIRLFNWLPANFKTIVGSFLCNLSSISDY